MGTLEQNTTLIYGIHIRESANDGSDFSNGATDYRVLFLGEDGQLHVKDSAGAVTVPPPAARGASVYKSGTQSLSDSTDTAITFDTEYFDTNSNHDTGSNTSRIVMNAVGKWLVTATIRFAANATGRRALYFRINANASSAGGTRIRSGDQWAQATSAGEAHVNGSAIINATAVTDYVEVFAFQTSTGALNVVADTAFEAIFLGV